MIILTDPSGLILETSGDPRTIDFGHLVHLEQGGRWKEADIGTNAIGTAIAKEELSSKEGDPCYRIQRAVELANIGLAEARRCAHDLRLSNVDESRLAVALQGLAERASFAGRLRCDFWSANIPEKSLPPSHVKRSVKPIPSISLC